MYDSGYVRIKNFKHVNRDESGFMQEFSLSRQQQEFVYVNRKKGSFIENSYHLGDNVATNPKTFILLSGEIDFSYRSLDSNDWQNVIVIAPALIEVQPKTVYSILALTDIITMECNSIADIEQDAFKELV